MSSHCLDGAAEMLDERRKSELDEGPRSFQGALQWKPAANRDEGRRHPTTMATPAPRPTKVVRL
jgi:hypothetical protein